MSAAPESGFMDLFLGKGFFQQVLFVLILLTLLFFIFSTFEWLLSTYQGIGGKTIHLMPYTVSSQDKQYVFHQNYLTYPDAKVLPLSDNERTGIEFTYSFFLYINPNTFTGTDALYHVLHKGYASAWPLLGPGVFLKGNTNTMRVAMNTYTNPYTYLDIDNIPVQKWFHTALVCRKNSLEVYINGNLRNRLDFKGTLPYQNFQDLHVFSPLKRVIRETQTFSLTAPIAYEGVFSGSLSNLIYLAYAASYTEIQSLMNLGVSNKTVSSAQDKPPYLVDTYWTTSYTQLA
jgi:hypothetical protein